MRTASSVAKPSCVKRSAPITAPGKASRVYAKPSRTSPCSSSSSPCQSSPRSEACTVSPAWEKTIAGRCMASSMRRARRATTATLTLFVRGGLVCELCRGFRAEHGSNAPATGLPTPVANYSAQTFVERHRKPNTGQTQAERAAEHERRRHTDAPHQRRRHHGGVTRVSGGAQRAPGDDVDGSTHFYEHAQREQRRCHALDLRIVREQG